MNKSEQINKLATALAKAHGMFPEIQRNRSVTVRLKDNKGQYEFTYATLDAILNAVRKPLAENGISISFTLGSDDKGEVCITELLHSSGQYMNCNFPVIVDNGANAQGWSSAMTYAKRAGLTAILAIHADEDDDGNDACGNNTEPQDRKRPQNGNGQRPQQPPPPSQTKQPQPAPAPITDDERLSSLYNFAERYKTDSALLLRIVIDMDVTDQKTTAFHQMQMWESPAKRQVGEMYLASLLSDADRATYFAFLIEQYKGKQTEIEFLGHQIPKQTLPAGRMEPLITRCCDILTAMEEAKTEVARA